jgi:2,3-bisphosphoglycerate-dependent phosphoglycerate mutase
MNSPTSTNLPRRLILVRHGQSTFNAENRFTGWRDPHLTARGEGEAGAVAQHLRDAGVVVDVVFTSDFQRTMRSAELILAALGHPAQVQASAALNERDYGKLTGLNKAEAAARWGADQVHEWRRSYTVPPPGGESLRDTVARAAPFYLREILPVVLRGSSVLVVTHGNTLRALVSALEGLTPTAVEALEIATGELLMYDVAVDAGLTRVPTVTTRVQ